MRRKGSHTTRVHRLALGTCVASLVAACSNDVRTARTTIVDSAGVTIVASASPAWDDSGWQVSESVTLEIGVVDGDTAYQLYNARDALRLEDGRIVVANDGSKELRYFDATGRHLASTGRSGRGPGEFMNLYVLMPGHADTVLVGDFTLRRIQSFDEAGTYAGMRDVVGPVGLLPDGSIIGEAHRPPPDQTIQNGPSRDQALLIRHAARSAGEDTIAILEGNESVIVIQSDGRTTGATGYRRPFGLVRMTSVFGDRIFTADGESAEVRVLDANGDLQRIFRFDEPASDVMAQDQQAYRERFLGPIPSGPYRARAESALEGDAFPVRKPVFQDLRLDRTGHVWLEEYGSDSSGPARWIILDPDGRWLGSVETPAGLRVTDIGLDYVLGVARDELDVEHVRLYDLTRTDPTGG